MGQKKRRVVFVPGVSKRVCDFVTGYAETWLSVNAIPNKRTSQMRVAAKWPEASGSSARFQDEWQKAMVTVSIPRWAKCPCSRPPMPLRQQSTILLPSGCSRYWSRDWQSGICHGSQDLSKDILSVSDPSTRKHLNLRRLRLCVAERGGEYCEGM